MKLPRPRHLLIILPFLLLNAAGWWWLRSSGEDRDGETVRIHAALPRGDADGVDRLTLVFDRSVGGEADSVSPAPQRVMTIEPRPAGRWRWATPERLEFVLEEPLPPGRVYLVKPTVEFESLTGWRIDEEVEHSFRTRRLSLVGVTAEVAEVDVLNLGFRFNQEVLPSDLHRCLTVKDTASGQTLDAWAGGWSASERLVVQVPRPEGESLQITVDEALTGSGGQRSLGRKTVRTVQVPKRFGLMGAAFQSFHDAGSTPDHSSVLLRFTSRLDQSASPPEVKIRPPVDADVSWGPRGSTVRVKALFECETKYTFTVTPGLRAIDGRVLDEGESAVLGIPARSPSVRIPRSRGILSPFGSLSLTARLVNVPRVRVQAWRVHDNNLVRHLQRPRRRATSRENAAREFEVEIRKNRMTEVGLNLGALLDAPLGIYRIEVDSTDHRWTDDDAVVAITDLGLTAKRGRDRLAVWVVSLIRGEPVQGARVTALSYNNQTLAEAESDEMGVALLDVPKNHPDGDPWVVTASHKTDRSYLRLDRNPWVLDEVDQSGREVPETYDVFIYTERGVYRPGDTVHLTGIVRDAGGETPEAFPLQITAERPDGREAESRTVAPGAGGVFHVDFELPEDAWTGPWTFDASLPASPRVLGGTGALVEAFLPARIELAASAGAELTFGDAAPSVAVKADYYFGRPGAALPLSFTYRYRPSTFRSLAFPRHRFGAFSVEETTVERHDAGRLDEQGKATAELPLPGYDLPGLYRMEFTATVTEPGSRSVSRRSSMLVDTVDRHMGVLLPESGWVRVNTPIPLPWVLRTPDDRSAAPARMEWQLHRVVREWEYRLVNGRWRYRSVVRTPLVATIPIDAATPEGEVEITCPRAGRYRLTIRDPETDAETRLTFLAADDESHARSLALARADRLELIPEQASFLPGSTARVLVRSPFTGTLLLTLETSDVVRSRVIALGSAEETVEIELPDDLRGGAFLSGTVVRPIDPSEGDWKPHRAMGLTRIETDHEAHRLALDLETADEAAPGTALAVSVSVNKTIGGEEGVTPAAGAVVHLWAVDEGILASSRFQTPDPFDHYLASRALGVGTNDLYPDLIPDLLPMDGVFRIGGGDRGKGGARRRSLRRNPVVSKRRLPSVVWREAVVADEEGRVRIELDTPDLRGAIRIMAVALAGDGYGSSERRVVLSTPIIAEAGWPRFLAPGDSRALPVKVFNGTEGERTLTVIAEFKGPIRIDGAPAEVTVPAGKDRIVWLDLEGIGVGPAEATVLVRTAGEEPVLSSRTGAAFPVRPAAPLHTETEFMKVEAGEGLTLTPGTSFLAGAHRRLRISAEPKLDLLPALESLLDYPYGCLEQTTSRLVAILHAPELLESLSASRAETVRDLITSGIRRLEIMQTASGGLAYWPGSSIPDRWGTSYAGSFLADAERAGFDIPRRLVEGVTTYITKELNAHGDRQPTGNVRALFCRILSAFGKPPVGWMERLLEDSEALDIAGRAHLAAAWLDAGRRDRALEAISGDTIFVSVPSTVEGRITSRTRQDAVLLSVLLDLDPEHAWLPLLAEKLLKSRKARGWRSTLENAAVIAALSRVQVARGSEGDGPAEFTVEVRCGDQRWKAGHEETRLIELPADDQPVEILSSGSGAIHMVLQTEGAVRAATARRYDHGMKVRRRWVDTRGETVRPDEVRVGDLVRVEVELISDQSASSKSIGNVAVVDALPGGFEVENPRLATSDRIRGNTDRPDRVEFLDDRIVLFATAGPSKRTFAYSIRATGAGSFVLPPIQASCMYEPDLSSIHGGGRVEVRR